MQRQLRCVIAAGGTAGHVLPALAVAEALTERGVYVTFAGSPDRVEAQLVPDAGLRARHVPDQRLPAAADAARSLTALYRAGVAPPACRAILRSAAAATSSSAAAATSRGRWCFAAGDDADSRCALGGRRAPRAREPAGAAVRQARLPGLSARRARTSRGSASSAGRSRRAPARSHRPRRARSSSCRRTGRCCSSRARSRARGRSTRWRSRRSARSGPAILHISGERDYASLQSRVQRDDYRLIPSTDRIGAAYSACRPRRSRAPEARSGRSRRRASRRSSCRIRSRPPTTRRRTPSTSSTRAARSWCGPRPRRRSRPSCARCSTTRASLERMGEAMLRAASRTRPTRSPRG